MLSYLFSWQSFLDIAWLLFLLFMLDYFWRHRKALVRPRSWLITKGHISAFEWTRVGTRLWPKIQYTYQVYDQEFQSEHLFLDTSLNSPNSKYARKAAYKAAIAYENNEEIDVFYNPKEPKQAVLDTSIPPKLNIIIALLIFLIILHLGVIVGRLL